MFDLGKILKRQRKMHGYTQAEVARRLNVTTATIGRYEHNDVKPPTEKLIELAILYNTPFNELVGEPIESTLSIEGLTYEQQHIIQAIAADFRRSKSGSPAGNYTQEQQSILSELFLLFNKRKRIV